MTATTYSGKQYEFQEDGITGTLVEHEDGTHGAFIPDGEAYAIPVEWVRGDGPDRLTTPTDWEQSYMSVEDALAASADPDWWAENHTLANELHPLPAYAPAADILRPAYMALPAAAKLDTAWTALSHGDPSPALLMGDAAFCLDEDQRDDEGTMLYTWTSYVLESNPWASYEDDPQAREDEGLYPHEWVAAEGDCGTEAEARAAVMIWALGVMGEQANAKQTERDADFAALADMVRVAVANGMPEQRAAKIAGIDRMTVRRWLGKR